MFIQKLKNARLVKKPQGGLQIYYGKGKYIDLPEDGQTAGSANDKIARGIGTLMSDTTGAEGEAVTAVTTPAGGSWTAVPDDRFGQGWEIQIPNVNTNGTMQINAPAGKPFARMTANTSIVIILKVTACNSDDVVQATLTADAPTWAQGAALQLALNANKAGGYWFMAIEGSQFGGLAMPFDLNGIRIRVERKAGGVTTKVKVCKVLMSPRAEKPALVMYLDDAFRSQFTDGFAVARAYGLKGNIAVIKSTVGRAPDGTDPYEYCTSRQLHTISRAKWGMCTHGYTPHNSAPLNALAPLRADLLSNRNYVRDEFGADGDDWKHYVLPAGQFHATTDQLLTELGFLTCRGTIGNQTVVLPDGTGVDNPYRLFCTPISANAGLADMKSKFDRARRNGWTIFMAGHRFPNVVTDPVNELSQADWEAFCAYVAPYVSSGEVLNPTIAEWHRSYLQ